VKNFHEVFVLANLIVDQNRAMRQFPNSGSLANCAAHTRESGQEFHMVEQGSAEAPGGLGIVFGDVADDFSEVVQRSLREEEAEIHLGRSSRTCSTETVRPDLASRIPSSIAARVASSSSSRIGTGFSKSDTLVLAITPC
jgi:hypothetical protein